MDETGSPKTEKPEDEVTPEETTDESAEEQQEYDLDSEDAQSYWEIVWEQFKKYRMSVWALYGVIGLVALAVYAPVVASDLPFTMSIDGERTFPWFANLFNKNYYENTVDIFFNTLMFIFPLGVGLLLLARRKGKSESKRVRQRLRRRAIVTTLAVVVAANLWIVVDPLSGSVDTRPESSIAQLFGWYESEFPQPKEELRRAEEAGVDHSSMFPPFRYSFRETSEDFSVSPSWEHPLGTDNIGRDVFSRMIFGTRIALTIGIVAVGIYLTIGIILGALAGYFGGKVDMIILRFIEIMICFPTLFLILTLAAFVEQPSVFYVMLIIGLTRWTGVARLVRGEFLRLRNQEFVQAAKALGLPEWRIIFKHVLPNALGPVLVAATFGVASAILIESTFSFLGLGDPAAPTWGKILNDGRVFRNNIMILLPGFAIFITVSLFNLMGEGLRDALDPKMRR